MLRKNYLIFVLMIAAILFGSMAAFAQTGGPVTGRVVLTDADGSEKPVPDALVEVYRTDVKTSLPSDKTNKKGDFAFANFQYGAVFALVVSGEGIEPAIYPNVRAGATNLRIPVTAGSGKKLTEEEVREQLEIAKTGGGQPSEADKKSAEEMEKARLENEKKKKEAEKFNAIIDAALKDGNSAFEKKNYDLAIAKFEEGYNANPEFLGTAPVFLTNKGIALGFRAVDYHNAGVKDKETRTENYAKANEDFNNGIDAFYQSWILLKNASEPEIAATSSYKANNDLALSGSKTLIGYTLQTDKVNPEKLDKVKELLEGYINSESDKTKKAEAQTMIADYYRASGEFDTAIAEYRKILSTSPNESGALFGLGISLVSTGYNDDGSIKKPQLQEAANILKKFIDVAPSTSTKIKAAKQTLVELDQGNGITPKK